MRKGRVDSEDGQTGEISIQEMPSMVLAFDRHFNNSKHHDCSQFINEETEFQRGYHVQGDPAVKMLSQILIPNLSLKSILFLLK